VLKTLEHDDAKMPFRIQLTPPTDGHAQDEEVPQHLEQEPVYALPYQHFDIYWPVRHRVYIRPSARETSKE
jgi:hypothetical protein